MRMDPAELAKMIRLDSNENPNPPGPAVIKAVTEALARGHRYPLNFIDLREKLAKLHGVARENVAVGAGSGEFLKAAIPAFVDPKRALVAPLPTFETCTSAARARGLPVREIPVDASLRLDVAAMEEAALGAGLVYFSNPNNPTGTIVPTREVEGMLDRLASRSLDTVVLLDEAYAHFVESQDYSSLAARAAKDPRLLVLRTFSKAFGLAGLRVGYAIGHKDTIARIKLAMSTDFLSVTSVAAAIAALEDQGLLEGQVRSNHLTRASTTKFFNDLGFAVAPSEGNFILADVQRKPDGFQAACKAQGVLVGRPFPGLPTHSRITMGTAAEMERATAVFKAVLSKPA